MRIPAEVVGWIGKVPQVRSCLVRYLRWADEGTSVAVLRAAATRPTQVTRRLAVPGSLMRAGGIGPLANDEGFTLVKKLVLLAIATAAVSIPMASPAEAVTDFPNCTALNKVYPHGVGLKKAHDHTSGTPVTNFARKPLVYKVNNESDGDHDGIACEKH